MVNILQVSFNLIRLFTLLLIVRRSQIPNLLLALLNLRFNLLRLLSIVRSRQLLDQFLNLRSFHRNDALSFLLDQSLHLQLLLLFLFFSGLGSYLLLSGLCWFLTLTRNSVNNLDFRLVHDRWLLFRGLSCMCWIFEMNCAG